jgi:hypothetical protein
MTELIKDTSRYGILFGAPAGESFDPEDPPYRVGDTIDVPLAEGPERVRVEYVEWFPNDGASVYVQVAPIEERKS